MEFSIMEVIPTILHGPGGIKTCGLQTALMVEFGIRVVCRVMEGILADVKALFIRFECIWVPRKLTLLEGC